MEQVFIILGAIIAICLVFKFMKGCIKAVVVVAIGIVAMILLAKVGGLDGLKDLFLNSLYFLV